jgi:hypothetical protein
MRAADAAGRIWDVLGHYIGGLTSAQMCDYAELTPSQLRRGLDYIRDLFEDEPDAPIITVYRGGEWLYVLATHPTQERDVREHWGRKLRGQITRARREHNDWHKTALKYPTPENQREEELARRRLVDLRYAYDLMFSGGAQEELI